MIAISRLLASWPPYSAGSARRSQPAASARRRISREQLLPVGAGHAAVLEVGAGPLPAVVEEPDVVVLLPRAA